MEPIRVLVAMSSENLIQKIKAVLQEQGYIVADTAANGHECLRKARTLKIDLAVVDFDILGINGAKISKILVEDDVCDVLLLASAINGGLMQELGHLNEITILTKPLNKSLLINSLELMAKSRRRAKALTGEINELKETLETRKIVEKAKGKLMKERNILEDEAFRIIQTQSMKTRKTMKEVAYSIVEGK